jgi:hypothetical protein
MYFNIAAGLTPIVRNTSYKPVWVNTAPLLKNSTGSPHSYLNDAANAMCGSGHWDKYPIFRIHVAKNALSDYLVRLWLFKTPAASPVDVPFTAFTQGMTYDMYFDKYTIVDSGGTEITSQDGNFILVGHLCHAYPIDL